MDLGRRHCQLNLERKRPPSMPVGASPSLLRRFPRTIARLWRQCMLGTVASISFLLDKFFPACELASRIRIDQESPACHANEVIAGPFRIRRDPGYDHWQ